MPAAPQYALAVYQALLKNGYSTVQAIGIMANMWHESGINPESSAMDSNGYRSVGLVSFNTAPGNFPNAGSMLTGNPNADINSQTRYLAQIAGPRSAAAAGSSDAQVAGNWAANFERCQGCQPGGSQYNARAQFASTVAGWASAGHWTVSSGTPGTGGSTGGSATGSGTGGGAPAGGTGTTGTQTTATDAHCLWSLGVVGCVITKAQARAIVGGLLLASGLVIGIVGLNMLLKAAGLGGSGMGKAAATGGEMLALFPPAEGAGVALSAVGNRANRVAGNRARGRAAATGERRAATGEKNARTSQRRAATGEKNARTAKSRAGTYQYRSRTDREVGRSRAKTYRKDAKTRRYAAETGRQREERLGTRRSRPAASPPKSALATAPARRTRQP